MSRADEFKAMGIAFLDELPKGWHYLEGASTAPLGYKWAGHGSRFWRITGGDKYEHALVKCDRDG